jgi:hypothetical protein
MMQRPPMACPTENVLTLNVQTFKRFHLLIPHANVQTLNVETFERFGAPATRC